MDININKITLLFVLLSVSKLTLFGQFVDTATMRVIEQNRSAQEGNLYLDTLTNVYKIGLTNGKLGWLTDNQKLDSLNVVNDSLFLFIERGNEAGIHLDSIKLVDENKGLNYFMWDIPNTSTPNISTKSLLGIPTGQGSTTNQLDNVHRSSIAPTGATNPSGYIIRYSGVFKVNNTGSFTFTSRSDDGTRIYIDGMMILESWFQQSPRTRTASVNLAMGEHLIEFWYYENSGGDYMEFFWGVNPDGYAVGSYMRGDQFYIK